MNASIKRDMESVAVLWKDGSSINVIAAKYGVSRQTVTGIIYRNRELLPKRNRQVLAIYKGDKVRRARNIHKARMEAARREAEEFEARDDPPRCCKSTSVAKSGSPTARSFMTSAFTNANASLKAAQYILWRVR